MQIQIQILIQLQYLPSWVPWRGNCLPPFPHNALPSIPRAEISLFAILEFMAYIFLLLYFFILNISLSICICICLTRSVEYPHGWDYAWDNSWISNLDTPLSHYPLPISRFIHQGWDFLDFALWISRQQTTDTPSRGESNTTSGVFQGKPWHLHIQGR